MIQLIKKTLELIVIEIIHWKQFISSIVLALLNFSTHYKVIVCLYFYRKFVSFLMLCTYTFTYILVNPWQKFPYYIF